MRGLSQREYRGVPIPRVVEIDSIYRIRYRAVGTRVG